jgi:hypothetical protein
LGITNYVREFIRGYAFIAEPLFAILKGENKKSIKKIILKELELESFNKLKQKLGHGTERSQPDFKKNLYIDNGCLGERYWRCIDTV